MSGGKEMLSALVTKIQQSEGGKRQEVHFYLWSHLEGEAVRFVKTLNLTAYEKEKLRDVLEEETRKAAETFDPNRGTSFQTWVRRRWSWAAASALRSRTGEISSHQKDEGGKETDLTDIVFRDEPEQMKRLVEDEIISRMRQALEAIGVSQEEQLYNLWTGKGETYSRWQNLQSLSFAGTEMTAFAGELLKTYSSPFAKRQHWINLHQICLEERSLQR